MAKYKRLDLDDRRNIENGLDKGLSFRAIGTLIGRAASVAKEVRSNRMLLKGKVAKAKCREAKTCKKTGICEKCALPGAVCARCEKVFCQEVCAYHLEIAGCAKTASAPWVCNGCRKRRCGCNRPGRYVYTAAVADKVSRERASTSRTGINMTREAFERVLSIVRPALARKLSPYEIATLYADQLKVSASTLYRWIEHGYGDMANIELQRKVGFAPRRQHTVSRCTSHGKERSYEAFSALPQDEQDGCCEMDTVIGKKTDSTCILTLYLRPAHFQLYLLLEEHSLAEVKRALDALEEVCGRHLFKDLFSLLLTDNGTEFSDPVLLETSVIPVMGRRSRIYYCDPRQSQQKGRCEKAHSELRQKLPKGTSFDSLDVRKLADVCEAVNSTPRKSLCGLTPIGMLYKAYGAKVGLLLDHLGIGQLEADDIDLSPTDMCSDEDLPF
jgi:IS30 family transposase